MLITEGARFLNTLEMPHCKDLHFKSYVMASI